MALPHTARDDVDTGSLVAKILQILESKLSRPDFDELSGLINQLYEGTQTTAANDPPGLAGRPQLGAAMDGHVYAFDSADPVKRIQDIRCAEAEVAPVVGPVAGMDSAAGVFTEALRRLGVDTWKIYPSALPHVFRQARRTGMRPAAPGMDSRTSAKLAEIVPGLSRIRNV